jgi:hypothetical protein
MVSPFDPIHSGLKNGMMGRKSRPIVSLVERP